MNEKQFDVFSLHHCSCTAIHEDSDSSAGARALHSCSFFTWRFPPTCSFIILSVVLVSVCGLSSACQKTNVCALFTSTHISHLYHITLYLSVRLSPYVMCISPFLITLCPLHPPPHSSHLTSVTSAKVLDTFTLTGLFLKWVHYWFVSSAWCPPCCISRMLMPKTSLYVDHGVSRGESGFLWIEEVVKKATCYTHQLSLLPTPLRKNEAFILV